MTQVKCMHCKVEIDKQATICPNCKKKQGNRFERHPKTSIVLAIILPLYYVVLSMWWHLTSGGWSYNVKTFDKNKMEMCIFAQKEIPGQLKAPDSATFPRCTNAPSEDKIVRVNAQIVLYTSYVHADNSFGAKIKNDYMCKIQYLSYPNYNVNCKVFFTWASQNEVIDTIKSLWIDPNSL